MARLPVVSGRKCINALTKVGFYEVRRESSHIYIRRDNPLIQISVPDHAELDRGTLKAILRKAGLSNDEFAKLLK
jgi:predicted RNA binding protein YcfA (HicA-like mRNA interferase family)